MTLELGSVPVRTVAFGCETRISGGALEIDRDGLARELLQRVDGLGAVSLQLARYSGADCGQP